MSTVHFSQQRISKQRTIAKQRGESPGSLEHGDAREKRMQFDEAVGFDFLRR